MQNQFTVVVSHFVKQGKEKVFENALKQVIQKAKDYKGYEGIQIINVSKNTDSEYILLIRFDKEANYKIWEQSTPRNTWFKELEEYITKESEIRHQEGLEFWFSLPQMTASVPPRKWKMALLTWMVIYPSVLTLSTVAGIYLDFMPLFIRMLIVSMILVSLMTYIIMPKITTVFASWIFKKE
ncbi:MAG: antibiotic biosynthesis monooxygenase [Bacteroidota bacterium]